MSREEDLIRSTTRAIAATVRDVPPLRLEPAPDELRSSPRAPRRSRGATRWRLLRLWAAPLTAAAVVVALAVSLVLVRDIPNGGAMPAPVNVVPTADTTVTDPGALGPDGVPRYYVAVQHTFTKPKGKPPVITTPLVAGDLRTGAKLATIPPPAGVTFLNVTAAGDDRTFVAAGKAGSGASTTIELFAVRLDPGATHPVHMTSLAVGPQPVGYGKSVALIAQTFPVALSGSGTELAVAEFAGPGGMAVKVFSVATGKLLDEWTTTDKSLSLPGLSQAPTLTWIDGDRALALATLGAATKSGKNNYVAGQTVRSLKVDGARNGDLIADSTVLRNVLAGGAFGDSDACGYQLQWPPVISADGKTFTCTTGGSFVTYPLAPGTAGSGPGRVDLTTGNNDFVNTVLWTSSSGDTLIAEWGVTDDGTVHPNGKGNFVQIEVISHGTSTALRFPPGFETVWGGDIAW